MSANIPSTYPYFLYVLIQCPDQPHFPLHAGNTVSNLIMILPPIYGALQTLRNGLEVRYVCSFLGLAGEYYTHALVTIYIYPLRPANG